MSQVPSYRNAADPQLEAARTRERLRALSSRSRASQSRGGPVPVLTLAAILLGCLLLYLNIGRNTAPVVVGKPACAAATQDHPCL